MPETVKDYNIQVRVEGSAQWQTIAAIEVEYRSSFETSMTMPYCRTTIKDDEFMT